MSLIRLAAPLAVAAALGLSACGGDDPDSTDDFIADADAICTDAARQLADQALALETPPANEKEVAAAYEQGDPVLADAQAQLEELEAPEEVSDDWDDYLAASQRRIDARAEAIESANDPQAFGVANGEALDALEARNEIGERIGLGPCADVLSDEDTQAVEDAEQKFAASPDPDFVCKEYFLPQAATEFYGSVQDCLHDPLAIKKTVQEIENVEGVDGVMAKVTVEVTNGPYPGRYLDTLYYVEGAWRLYDTVEAPRPPESGKAT